MYHLDAKNIYFGSQTVLLSDYDDFMSDCILKLAEKKQYIFLAHQLQFVKYHNIISKMKGSIK